MSEVCSQIVLNWLYLARIGRPDILWSVNKLAKPVTTMDSGMWQKISKIDFLFSSHWPSTILSCGKHSWRPWRGVFFWSWMCKKTNFGFAQLYRILSYFSGCRTTYAWVTCSWTLGHSDWGFYVQPKIIFNPNIHRASWLATQTRIAHWILLVQANPDPVCCLFRQTLTSPQFWQCARLCPLRLFFLKKKIHTPCVSCFSGFFKVFVVVAGYTAGVDLVDVL